MAWVVVAYREHGGMDVYSDSDGPWELRGLAAVAAALIGGRDLYSNTYIIELTPAHNFKEVS